MIGNAVPPLLGLALGRLLLPKLAGSTEEPDDTAPAIEDDRAAVAA